MAVIKVTNSKATLSKAINYVTKEEKTEERLVSGKDCSPSTALEEMQATKEQFNKLEGRQYYHYVQSFAKTDNITHQKAHEIALEWAEKNFKGHEVLITTHQDKDHVHTHFIVNSVSHENGKKFQSSKKDLEHLKVMSDKICEREGFSVIKEKNLKPDQFTSFNQGKYQMMQKLEQGKQVNSYLFNTAVAVDKSIEISKSRTDFIKNMNSQGYETKWSDTNKNVTFKDLEGHKVRLSNLEKTFNNKNFSKEEIENGFSRIKGKELAKTTEPIRGSRTEQQPNQTTRTEHEGENGVRKHTSKREFGDIQATIRGVEQGVKGNPKQDVGNIKQSPERKARGDNEDLQSDDKTSSRTKNKQQNDRGSHEPRIEPIEPQHRKTIEPAKPKNKSRSYNFER